MGLNMEAKQAIVEEVSQVASRSSALVAADFSGLTVGELETLRAAARQANVYLKVVKNNLLLRAVEGTDFECIRGSVAGPLVLAFSSEEPSAAARIVRDFHKGKDVLAVRFLVLGGRLLGAGDLEAVAKLPNREEALATMMGVMKAPISKLVGTLAAPHVKLVRTLVAVRNSKQG